MEGFVLRHSETISSGQLAVLFLSFTIGSSTIYIPQLMIEFSGNVAWLAVAIANVWGGLVLASVLYLAKKYPELTFIEYSSRIFGRWIAAAVGALLILMLLVMLVFIVISIGGFFVASMMNETPAYIFNALTMLLAAATVNAGIEVMARLYTILLTTLLLFVYIILITAVPHYHLEQLLPLFPQGVKPLLHGAYYASGFPYAETALFAMLIPFVRKDDRSTTLGKSMYIANAVSGVTLIFCVLVPVLVMGPLAVERQFSLYGVAQIISIYDIVERMESIMGITLIVGSYMKAVVVLFILNLVISQLFRFRSSNMIVYPLAVFVMLLSATMYSNEMGYADAVSKIWPLMAIILGAVPVLTAALITFVKEMLANRQMHKT